MKTGFQNRYLQGSQEIGSKTIIDIIHKLVDLGFKYIKGASIESDCRTFRGGGHISIGTGAFGMIQGNTHSRVLGYAPITIDEILIDDKPDQVSPDPKFQDVYMRGGNFKNLNPNIFKELINFFTDKGFKTYDAEDIDYSRFFFKGYLITNNTNVWISVRKFPDCKRLITFKDIEGEESHWKAMYEKYNKIIPRNLGLLDQAAAAAGRRLYQAPQLPRITELKGIPTETATERFIPLYPKNVGEYLKKMWLVSTNPAILKDELIKVPKNKKKYKVDLTFKK